MKLRRKIKEALKTVPGKVAAALVTASVGAVVAYFAPGIIDSVTGNDELQINLQTNAGEVDTFDDLGSTVVVPFDKTAAGNPGQGCTDFLPWAAQVGGVRAARSDFRLVVQGGSEEVYIGGMRARLLERLQPLKGTAFRCPSGGAAEIRSVVIDLDQRGSGASGVWVEGDTEKAISFTVGPGETEVFDVTAHTEDCFCRWILELVTTQGGEEKIVAVDDHGQPFETTAWEGGSDWEDASREDLSYYQWNWDDAWNRTLRGDYETDPVFRPSEGAPPSLPMFGSG